MKSIVLLSIVLTISLKIFCQPIQLTKASFRTFNKSIVSEAMADSAIVIANAVFNSPDFKDSIEKLSFVDSNDCECNKAVVIANNLITGRSDYTVLFSDLHPKLRLIVKKSRPLSLGKTKSCAHKIKSFYENIKRDMMSLYFAHALAVNLCHEYMHTLGYCHPHTNINKVDKRSDGEKIDLSAYNNDVAYRVGWIVYDILNKWRNIKKRVYPYLNTK